MTPEQQTYLPAIAEHAKEWVSYYHCDHPYLLHKSGTYIHTAVRETELLQLMQWIEEREELDTSMEYADELTEIVQQRKDCYRSSARWHERWQAICKVKGWKVTL